MTLRARLVLVVIAVTAAGLAVSGVVTTAALRSYLLDRVDSELQAAEPFAAAQLTSAAGAELSDDPFFGNLVAARIASDGTVVDSRVHPLASAGETLGALPPSVLADARAGRTDRSDTTIDGIPYRVLAEPVAGSSDVVVVLAPTNDVDQTIAHVRRLELFVALGLLLVATVLATWLVRVGLRPLVDMAATADAIAEGDLDRRVASSGGREVEHLATALNAAFDARQASEETLRRFVADASHELRSPLATIRGYAELQRAGALNDPDTADRASRRIAEEAARMGALVDDLLLLSRLDEGRPLGHDLVDLRALAGDAVLDARTVDATRRLELVASSPVLMVGDQVRLHQVVGNLLANVRDHTPEGTTATVTVATDGGDAVLSVHDDGPGIGPTDGEAVFQRFWRADAARGHREGAVGGSGLGLAIVQGVVVAHGGTVTADGGPGRGTTVTIRLPLAPATPDTAPARDPQPI